MVFTPYLGVKMLPAIKPIETAAPNPSAADPVCTVTNAAETPASATTEPIERSIPPVKITYVIPTAKIPMTAMLKATFTRLSNEKNDGARKANTAISSKMAKTMM